MMFFSADQMHVWHLQTGSYAQHKALNGYYDTIRDQIDAFAECYMGYSGERLSAKGGLRFLEYSNVEQVNLHLDQVCKFCGDLYGELERMSPKPTHLLNIVDEMKATIAKTKYLLTLS